jgi:hypothetical protein
MGSEWDDLVHDLTLDMAGLEYQQFVIVEFNTQMVPNPYAQATPNAAGEWMCEVVSEHYLGAECWPLDELALASRGWNVPTGPEDNWEHRAGDARLASLLLVEALRFGRVCPDPRVFTWRIGRFPPPGDGGAPGPRVPRGPFGLAA